MPHSSSRYRLTKYSLPNRKLHIFRSTLVAVNVSLRDHQERHRVELTLWQALACAVGTIITIAVEAVFHSLFPRNDLSRGLDDRLSAVQGLIHAYAEDSTVPDDVSNRLAKYTVVGVSGLRRNLARSRYEQLYRDQFAAVIALTGRLVDLGASSANSPCNVLHGDRAV
jgi:multidrug resistance protein MdtO